MSEIAIRCSGLSKAFGNVQAVSDFDLTVERGQIIAVLGPSGCGKTTALRLVAGFETPDAGTIEIDGRTVATPSQQVPPEKRRLGMVFQDYALFPHLSVAENVAFGVRRERGWRDRVREVLALVGLTGLESRMPHELSGGQQQRVALARALAPRPVVVLLDEPFSNLDAGLRVQVRQEVLTILRAAASTAIFVTHDQQEALYMGDQVAVMHGGRLEQMADPETLFHRPATRFVAEFMGVADFLPAIASRGGLVTEIGTVRPLGISTDLMDSLSSDSSSSIEVMMRPDDVSIEYSPRGQGKVVAVAFQGAHYLYEVVLPSGQTVRVLQPHTLTFYPGTPVAVQLAPDHDLSIFVAGRAVARGVVMPWHDLPQPDVLLQQRR